MTRSLHCSCSSQVPQPLTGNNIAAIDPPQAARSSPPESMRDAPTQRQKKASKDIKLLTPGRQTETRESKLHPSSDAPCGETRPVLLLTDDRGENREAPLRVVLCGCAFPQFWHVIFRREEEKKRIQRRFNIHSQINGGAVRVSRRRSHRAQRCAPITKALNCQRVETFAHEDSPGPLFPSPCVLAFRLSVNGSVAVKVRHLLSDTSQGDGWSVRASLCQI